MNRLLMLLASIAVSLTLHAQNPQATLDKAGHVKLPYDIPLANAYEIDLAPFSFENELDAVEFFRTASDQKHFYRPVYSQQIAILYLQVKLAPEWTISQWNDYFQSRSLFVHEEMSTPLSE